MGFCASCRPGTSRPRRIQRGSDNTCLRFPPLGPGPEVATFRRSVPSASFDMLRNPLHGAAQSGGMRTSSHQAVAAPALPESVCPDCDPLFSQSSVRFQCRFSLLFTTNPGKVLLRPRLSFRRFPCLERYRFELGSEGRALWGHDSFRSTVTTGFCRQMLGMPRLAAIELRLCRRQLLSANYVECAEGCSSHTVAIDDPLVICPDSLSK